MTWILLTTLSVLATSPAAPRADSITITRLQYPGGGDWYGDPSSLPNLLSAIRERTGIQVTMREQTVTPMDPSLPDHPYLYMTGHGNVQFSPAERAALRAYLLRGGFLHADDNYGMDQSFRREMRLIFPDIPLVEIPASHPVFHDFYDFPEGIPKVHEHDNLPAQALGIFVNGRLAVFYSYQSDLGDGWEDPEVHQDPPAVREQALRMGVNLFLYVLGQAVP
ncbi:MAG: DUF4159 domain-containing protein [Gemmatimonadetes bacterium]|nr:DUF4159 domain-containing protein [Gemmatimonadota bacterium]